MKVLLNCADDRLSNAGDDGTGWADVDFDADNNPESADLLQAPRKVEKITVSYSKASKQVNVPYRRNMYYAYAICIGVQSAVHQLHNCLAVACQLSHA